MKKKYGAFRHYKMFFTGQALYLQNNHTDEVLPDHYKEVPYKNPPTEFVSDLFKSTDEYQPGMRCYQWCSSGLNIMHGDDPIFWREV